jgi:hypothetical protein
VTVEPQHATLAGARLLAEVRSYSELMDALRARACERQLALSSPALAAVAGLPDGYIAKLLGPGKVRTFAWASMGPVLAVLGAKLLLVVDQQAIDNLDHRLPKWNGSKVHSRSFAINRTVSRAHMRKIGLLGAKKRASLKLKDMERKELNRSYVRKHLASLDEDERRARWRLAKAKQRKALREAAPEPATEHDG